MKNLQVVVNTARPKPALALASGVPSNVTSNVPASETSGYQLVYQANLPTANGFTAANYVVNNAAQVANGSFNRIAYYLELKDNSNVTKWVWVSSDAFTAAAGKIGVPLTSTGALFQGKLTGANVFASGNSGITGGTGLSNANIEFWPTNYDQHNQEGITGSSDTTFDSGDEITPGTYGSMQIHAGGQTLFAFNHWGGTPAPTTSASATAPPAAPTGPKPPAAPTTPPGRPRFTSSSAPSPSPPPPPSWRSAASHCSAGGAALR